MDNMDIYTAIKCPCCGHDTYDSFWICPECGWEYDGTVLDESYSSANGCTLQEYKKDVYACKKQNK